MNRDEVARVLRRARGRIRPEDVGIPGGERRRVAGLRREEVATLAGVSVDYVVRLEQGRGPHPSAQVLGSLARALRMSDDERRELFDLAGVALPRGGEITLLVRASIHRLLDRLTDNPAVVLSAKGDILAWNVMAAALLGDFSRQPPRERNLAWQRFLGEPGRVSLSPEEQQVTAAQTVANLRTTVARYPHDPGLQRLLDDLRA
ncbi:MAG: helix-turn-helix transcriptional regulator, partial [Lapillicoccus sp.]